MFGTQVFYNFTLFDGVNSQVQPDCWLEVTDGLIYRIGVNRKNKDRHLFSLSSSSLEKESVWGRVLKYNKSYIVFAHDQDITDIIFRSNLLQHFQKKYYTNDLS